MADEQPPDTEDPSPSDDPDAAAGEQSSGMEDSSPSDDPGAAADGNANVRRTLCRSSTDKVIAGVAGGIGAYFGIDSVIVRIAFIVLTFLGGAGPFLYLIGWLALPKEDSRSVIAKALGGDSPHRFRSLFAVLLIGLGLLITANLSGSLFGLFVGVWSIAPYLALILIAAGVALVLWPGPAGRYKPTPARPPAPPAPAPGAPPSAVHVTPAPPPPTAAGPEWAASSPAISATIPGSAHVPASRPRRQRSTIGVLTIAALLVYTGGAVMLGRLEAVEVDIAAFLAIALAITGAGLVVSAFVRPARGLLAVGLVLVPVSVLFAGANVSWWSGVGERRVAPLSSTELQSEYRHGIGQLVLDLKDLQLDGAYHSIDVNLAVGEVLVYVPDDIRLTAAIELGAGAVTKRSGELRDYESGISRSDSWGAIDSGIGVDTTVMSSATGTPEGELGLDIDVGIGAVDIVTVPSTGG